MVRRLLRPDLSGGRIWRWVIENPDADIEDAREAWPDEKKSQLEIEFRSCHNARKLILSKENNEKYRSGDTEDEMETPDEKMRQPDAVPINRIYYGPPGTGKTWTLSSLLKTDYTQSRGSDKERREQIIGERIATLTRWEGMVAALYDLGGRATVAQMAEHPFIVAIAAAKGQAQSRNFKRYLWTALQLHSLEDSVTVKYVRRNAPGVFDKSEDAVWYLAGDWRESCADIVETVDMLKAGGAVDEEIHRYSFVTFHQSYGYEEFVEGLRPMLDEEAEGGQVRYEIRAGVFKRLCERARREPQYRFAMVIDEINRGNISKIFGELITLIEPDKREGAENAISVTLPYSGEVFSVPKNIDIIGTMNTADRSLALLDTALRRRFEFIPVMPEPEVLQGISVNHNEKTVDLCKMLTVINERIEALYDRDHTIGHAYFVSLGPVPSDQRFDTLGNIFKNRILPLLEEYFFEDWQKIRLVLADNQKPSEHQFLTESDDHESSLARLFGYQHDLDSYAAKRRYSLQPSALQNPDAFIGIYSPPR